MHASPQGTPNAAPSGGPFIPSQSGMGGVSGQGGHGGPATPTRSHGVVPGVVISPSTGTQVRLHHAGVRQQSVHVSLSTSSLL